MKRPSAMSPRRIRPACVGLASLSLALMAASCAAPPPDATRAGSGDSSAGGTGGTTSGGGGSGSGTNGDGTPFDRNGACAVLRDEVTFERRPVDVILVVDNSSSMTNEIRAIEANLNDNLASIIEQSALDYRIILLSQHGDAATDQSVCITAPLSGHASCNPLPPHPANTARFFHYAQEVLDATIYEHVVDTYDRPDPNGATATGWSAWLRAEAFKTFVVITDEDYRPKEGDPLRDERWFDAQLLQLDPANFGDDD